MGGGGDGGGAVPQIESSPPPASTSTPAPASKKPPIGPAVRLLLSSYGISSDQITGTGPNGIVLKEDVMAYVKSKGLQKIPQEASKIPSKGAVTGSATAPSRVSVVSTSSYVDIPVSEMSEFSAKRLIESKTTIPHAYTRITFSADRLFALQKAINRAQLVDFKISINDLILKACAYALRVGLYRLFRHRSRCLNCPVPSVVCEWCYLSYFSCSLLSLTFTASILCCKSILATHFDFLHGKARTLK
ncbi:unnamed protein product [Hydatigera taeniaeformis]|uniref:Peripheral subunit-binding (PSBD) domain-containing protein n=1 Tax=Hydatigena taeniaeformis TaxID=6205 RepID=A0A3P7H1T6_HYDTA|nr:unnamed protein product [Hydatigera taeniaeformis]